MKSDKVDSEFLATHRRRNEAHSFYAPPAETRDLSGLVQYRLLYREAETRVMNHIYAVMMPRGSVYEPGILTSRRKHETLRSLRVPAVD
ncbi:MAG: hypothetical protein ACREBZ_05790 [Thermoplasmata archaeon]